MADPNPKSKKAILRVVVAASILAVSLVLNGVMGYLLYLSRDDVHRRLARHFGTVDTAFFGDSITEGGGTWDWTLGHYGSFRTENFGEGGAGLDRIASTTRFRMQVLKHKPSVVSIMAGANHLRNKGNPEEAAAMYLQLLDDLKQYKCHVLVTSTLPKSSEDTQEFPTRLNQRLREYAAKNPFVTYIDLWPLLTDGKKLLPEMTTDGVHITGAAYRVWAAKLNEALAHLAN